MTNTHPTLPTVAPMRLAVLLGVPAAVALGCWVWLGIMVVDMSAMPGRGAMDPYAPLHLFGLFVMWTVMMVAMMLPTAAPMTRAFAKLQHRPGEKAEGVWLTVLTFAGGYVAAWAAFSAVATGLQAVAVDLALLSPTAMKLISGPVAGAVLIAAGIYQWLPLKHACLKRCRSPIGFLMTEWRDGPGGAFVMGWRHGLFCIGCCAALMALLFVAGVMNVVWIVGLAVYVLIEKTVPYGALLSRIAGVALAGAGVWLIAA